MVGRGRDTEGCTKGGRLLPCEVMRCNACQTRGDGRQPVSGGRKRRFIERRPLGSPGLGPRDWNHSRKESKVREGNE